MSLLVYNMKNESIKLRFNITEWNQWNYWGITKCGNTSVKKSLFIRDQRSKNFDKPDHYGADVWVHDETNVQYIDRNTALINGNKNFTVVRNPYTRFLSMWKDIHRRPSHFFRYSRKPDSICSFIEMLESKTNEERDVHFRDQTFFITDDSGNILPEYVFDLDQDAMKMNRILDIQMCISNSIDYTIELDKHEKNRIYKLFLRDFKILEYPK